MENFNWGSILNPGPETIDQRAQIAPLALTLDQVGSRIAPKNAFAGIGTSLGQSAIANKQRAENKADQKTWVEQMIKALTMKDQKGPSSIKFKVDNNGQLVWTADGVGGEFGLSMDSPTRPVEAPNPLDAAIKNGIAKPVE